jgi:hypothetical protein
MFSEVKGYHGQETEQVALAIAHELLQGNGLHARVTFANVGVKARCGEATPTYPYP